jgi:hypothetical protein
MGGAWPVPGILGTSLGREPPFGGSAPLIINADGR